MANVIAPSTIAVCITGWYLLPKPPAPPSPIVLGVHYLGMLALLCFLILGVICHRRAWAAERATNLQPDTLANTYGTWWVATSLMPAPAAFLILASGLRLAYDHAANGELALPWLFWLAAAFAFFFFDGLLFYLPETNRRYKAARALAKQQISVGEYHRDHRSRASDAMLLLHALSLPFVFAIGLLKPSFLPHPEPLAQYLQALFAGFAPEWGRVLALAALIASIGFLLLLVRLPGLIRTVRFLRLPLG